MCALNEKDDPLAAISCYLCGLPSIILGLALALPSPKGVEGGTPCLWGVLYLAGAAMTLLLAITSLVRREPWKSWTILCALAALLPIAVAILGEQV